MLSNKKIAEEALVRSGFADQYRIIPFSQKDNDTCFTLVDKKFPPDPPPNYVPMIISMKQDAIWINQAKSKKKTDKKKTDKKKTDKKKTDKDWYTGSVLISFAGGKVQVLDSGETDLHHPNSIDKLGQLIVEAIKRTDEFHVWLRKLEKLEKGKKF